MRSGPLEFNATDYDDSSPASGGPNDFGPTIDFDTTFTYQGGDLLLEYTHSPSLTLNLSIVESRADGVNGFNDTAGNPLVESLFGTGFDAPERTFEPAPGFASIVQFSVIPEPSVGLLGGMALLGLLRRRR